MDSRKQNVMRKQYSVYLEIDLAEALKQHNPNFSEYVENLLRKELTGKHYEHMPDSEVQAKLEEADREMKVLRFELSTRQAEQEQKAKEAEIEARALFEKTRLAEEQAALKTEHMQWWQLLPDDEKDKLLARKHSDEKLDIYQYWLANVKNQPGPAEKV